MLQKVKKIILEFRKRQINKERIEHWRHIFNYRNKLHQSESTKLNKNEIKEINSYYAKFGLKPSPIFHQFYKHCTGKFDVRLIPDDLYYTYIDPFFNNWKLASYMDNKSLYYLIFPEMRQPTLLAYRQNGYWFNSKHNIVKKDKIVEILLKDNDSFVKQATESEGGKGIYVVNKHNSIQEIIDILGIIKGDIVVQDGLRQSETLSKLNESSVNTIRLITFLKRDGSVKLCSTSLRMGINGAKVDNASSGGITVGVRSDGSLNEIAYSASGESFLVHPTSQIKFSSIVIPNYLNIVDLVKVGARQNPHFRLISWDIALDLQDNPVLIEANFKYGELEFHQLNNGPIFGEDTDEILSEVFCCNQ